LPSHHLKEDNEKEQVVVVRHTLALMPPEAKQTDVITYEGTKPYGFHNRLSHGFLLRTGSCSDE
jgi:hypothetical protein